MEPDPVREEEVGGTGQEDQVVQLLRMLHLTSQVERTDLRNVELEVVSEMTGEVGVDPRLALEVLDGVALMSIEPDQRLDDSKRSVLAVIRIILQFIGLRETDGDLPL